MTWIVAQGAPFAANENKPVDGKNVSFTKDIVPLLEKYCIQCHGGDKPKADLSFSRYEDEASVLKDREVWEQVAENVRTGVMPPKGKPKPAAAEVEKLAGWVERFLAASAEKARNPGRVTIRRLNRAEYNNTIRDLVGVQFQPADDFPADDVGYGFDNIGDVLAMPPILLEKYLAAAEKIMAAAIVTEPQAKPSTKRWVAGELSITENRGGDRKGWKMLHSNGEIFTTFDCQRPGGYILRARAYGQQAGDEPVKMAFRVNGRDLETVNVRAIETNPRTYETRFRAERGGQRIAVAFTNDYFRPDEEDPAKRDRNLFVEFLEVEGPVRAGQQTIPESHKKIMIAQPTGNLDRRDCARQIVETFARKAFRRPVTRGEVNRLLRIYDLAEKNGESFERCIQLTLQAVLVSPHFLYRVELDREPVRPDGSYSISDFELATRLSYFLWSSMPDDELFAAAEQGILRKDGNLEAQVRRMLKDPQSKALVENFAGQWLQIRNLKTFMPDPELFPSFDEGLRSAMIQETELFFEHIMREDRSVLEFLDADYAFVNERLARHYGIPGVRGSQFRKVTLSGDQRGGLLTQASILTVTSNPTRTSPVKRGKWILENILNTPPPPPVPDAGELKEDKDAVLSGSLRQRMERHRADPNCASCHQRMDPLGFAFENYDAIGAWRSKDGNFDIDSSGTLPDGKSFKGPKELKRILLEKDDQFRRCLVDRLLTYALGRGLEPYDKPVVNDIAEAVKKDQNRFSTLVLKIVESDPFQMRRGPRGAK